MVEGSSVPRRQLGRYLKAERERAGLSVEAAARGMEWSKQKVYRIEAGQGVVLRTLDILAMCKIYGTPDDFAQVLVSLAGEAKTPGWWHAYGDTIPEWFELYVGLESAATQLRHYEQTLVPGLLQTRGYATAVLSAGDSDVERAVEARMVRQRLLARSVPSAPMLDVVLNESVLRQPIADRQEMVGQLTSLAEAQAMPNISLRILPMAAGPHKASGAGSFVLLDFPGSDARREPTTVYAELLTGAIYLDRPSEVAVHEAAWAAVTTLALDASRSTDLLWDLAKEYRDA
jgi:transcriptional regulator with XRE-family HTH domain